MNPNMDPAITSPLSADILQDVALALGQEVLTVTSLMHGQSHQVYKIELPGGQKFCLRTPKTKESAAIAKRGLEVLKFLKETRPSLQAPAVIHEAARGYTILQYLDGDPVAHNQHFPLNKRQSLLKGLASFLFSLWTVTFPNRPGTTLSYYDWLHAEIDKGFRRSLENESWGEPLHFLHRRVLASRFVPAFDDATMGIKHGDLNPWNVLVNAEGLSGVIDWDTAQTVPLPATVHHPLFIADIPGWYNDSVSSNTTLHQDQQILEHEVGQLAATSNSPSAMRIPELLSTSFERQFFELSLRNKVINNEYITARLLNHHIDSDVALEQLDRFLGCNEDLREHNAVLSLRAKLLDCSHTSI